MRPDQEFLVITSSYRASGGGHFDAPRNCPLIFDTQASGRDVLCRYIANNSPVNPRPLASWSFAPMGGTSVRVETGAGALKYPGRLTELGLVHRGKAGGGFHQFEMRL